MIEVITLGVMTMLAATAVQAVSAAAVVRAFAITRRRYRLTGMTSHVVVLQLVMAAILASSLVQIWLWATILYARGLVPDMHQAFFVAASNFTTLGAEGTSLPTGWRLLGPFTACNGIMMFGGAASVLYAIKRRLLAGVLR